MTNHFQLLGLHELHQVFILESKEYLTVLGGESWAQLEARRTRIKKQGILIDMMVKNRDTLSKGLAPAAPSGN